jgi:hypothetical protein
MAALARLHAGTTVRVHVVGQGWLNGLVARNHADSLVLGLNGRERVVPTAAIDSVLVRHGHAVMGAGLGALAGMFVGASVAGCDQPTVGSLAQVAASIGASLDCGITHAMVGLAVGAVLGAIVGGGTPSWEHRLPARERRREASSPVSDH